MKLVIRVLFILLLLMPAFIYAQSGSNVIPPQLVHPNSSTLIQESFPTFSWMPIQPNTSSTSYTLRIVEVLSSQTPEAAIQSNPDWYMVKDLTSNIFLYPVSAPLFRKGVKYAWQVIGVFNDSNADALIPRQIYSEVLSFELAELAVKTTCKIMPKEKLGELFYMIDDYNLRFYFENDSHIDANKLEYQLLDDKTNVITKGNITPEKVGNGEYYLIPLKKYQVFRNKANKGKFYFLEAKTKEGQIYSVKFTTK